MLAENSSGAGVGRGGSNLFLPRRCLALALRTLSQGRATAECYYVRSTCVVYVVVALLQSPGHVHSCALCPGIFGSAVQASALIDTLYVVCTYEPANGGAGPLGHISCSLKEADRALLQASFLEHLLPPLLAVFSMGKYRKWRVQPGKIYYSLLPRVAAAQRRSGGQIIKQ